VQQEGKSSQLEILSDTVANPEESKIALLSN
jgi:hypothetical protein